MRPAASPRSRGASLAAQGWASFCPSLRRTRETTRYMITEIAWGDDEVLSSGVQDCLIETSAEDISQQGRRSPVGAGARAVASLSGVLEIDVVARSVEAPSARSRLGRGRACPPPLSVPRVLWIRSGPGKRCRHGSPQEPWPGADTIAPERGLARHPGRRAGPARWRTMDRRLQDRR